MLLLAPARCQHVLMSASCPCVCLMATHLGTAAAMQVWQERLWAFAQALWAAAHPEGSDLAAKPADCLSVRFLKGIFCRLRCVLPGSTNVCCALGASLCTWMRRRTSAPAFQRMGDHGPSKNCLLSAVGRGCAEGAGRLGGPGRHRGRLLGPGAQAVRGADVRIRGRRRVVPVPGERDADRAPPVPLVLVQKDCIVHVRLAA